MAIDVQKALNLRSDEGIRRIHTVELSGYKPAQTRRKNTPGGALRFISVIFAAGSSPASLPVASFVAGTRAWQRFTVSRSMRSPAAK